jgi:hypothetical protein
MCIKAEHANAITYGPCLGQDRYCAAVRKVFKTHAHPELELERHQMKVIRVLLGGVWFFFKI